MKIKDPSPVQLPAVTGKATSGSSSANDVEDAKVQDKVSVSAPVPTDVKSSIDDTSRAAAVQQIISAVKSGQYYPSPQQIAQQMVTSAEVDVKLRALLG